VARAVLSAAVTMTSTEDRIADPARDSSLDLVLYFHPTISNEEICLVKTFPNAGTHPALDERV
jgi:hypothetical protein